MSNGTARFLVALQAVKGLLDLPDDHPRNDGSRFGRRWDARGVVDQIVADFYDAA